MTPEPVESAASAVPAPAAAKPAPASTEPRPRFVSRTFASMRHRDFRLFYVGQLISVTGTWMQTVALGWFVLELTGSELLLGLATVARSLPVLLLSVAGGLAADRFDRRRLLLAANGSAMVLSGILAALTIAGSIDVAGLLLLALLLGLTTAVEMPARQSYFVELVGQKDLANAIALNSMLFNSARLVGPALAGVVVAFLGPGVAFALNAASYGAVIVGLLLIAYRPVARAGLRARGALAEAYRYLGRERSVSALLFLLAANTVFASSYIVLGPAIARDLGVGAEGLGLLLSATGLGAIGSGLVLASGGARLPPGRLLPLAGLALAGLLVGVALSGSFVVTVLLLVGAGAAMVAYTATSNTVIQSIVPDALRGRVMSVYTTVMLGFMPLAGLWAGLIAEQLGASRALGIGALVWAVIVAAAFGLSPRLRAL
jgi:MFS family permease